MDGKANMSKELVEFLLLVGLLVLLIIAAPLFAIWSWNVLFGSLHAIPYSLETWFAAAILFGVFKAKVGKND